MELKLTEPNGVLPIIAAGWEQAAVTLPICRRISATSERRQLAGARRRAVLKGGRRKGRMMLVILAGLAYQISPIQYAAAADRGGVVSVYPQRVEARRADKN
jgi:hypothetical protein